MKFTVIYLFMCDMKLFIRLKEYMISS